MFETLLAEIASSGARHIATSIGAILVAHGLANMSQEQSFIGSVVFLVGFGFSVWNKQQTKKKLAAAKAA